MRLSSSVLIIGFSALIVATQAQSQPFVISLEDSYRLEQAEKEIRDTFLRDEDDLDEDGPEQDSHYDEDDPVWDELDDLDDPGCPEEEYE